MPESRIAATERLRREGRWDEASHFRDEQRRRFKTDGMSRGEASDAAWAAMLDRYPPLPNIERAECVAQSACTHDPAKVEALMAKLQGNKPDRVRDTLWVYEILENPRPTPDDAPSIGALSLLSWARSSRVQLFEKMLTKAMAVQPNREESVMVWPDDDDDYECADVIFDDLDSNDA